MNLFHLESLSNEKSIFDFLTIIFENINNGNQSLTLKTIGFLDSFGEFSTLTNIYMTHLTDQVCFFITFLVNDFKIHLNLDDPNTNYC